MDHDHVVSAQLLARMRPGFEAGAFKPFPILDGARFGLEDAEEAYRLVLEDRTRDRIIIQPQG
jgi:hypothetical protein